MRSITFQHFMARLMFPQHLLARTVALVGNGPISPEASEEIDSHDLVIRFNAARSHGVAGKRTDVLVLANTGYPGRCFASDGEINEAALGMAGMIWFPRERRMVRKRRASCDVQDRECWQDAGRQIVKRRIAGKWFRWLPASAYRHAENVLRPLGMAATHQPSSGMLVLAHLDRQRAFVPSRQVSLYGFTHQGWNRHPWDAEREFVAASPWIAQRTDAWMP